MQRLEMEFTFFLLQAQTNCANLEKKQKKFDQQINEWKIRCDELQADVDNAQKEARNYSTEVGHHIVSLQRALSCYVGPL